VRVGRLATKFSLAIGLLVTTYLALMSVAAVTAGRQSIRDQVLAAQRTAATLTARAVEQYVADAVGIMQEAPGRPKLGREIRDANWAEAAKVLENFLQHFRQFDYVAVLDPTGVLRARVPDAEAIGQALSFQDAFRGAMRTRRPHVTGVYVATAGGRPEVAIAVPVLDDSDTVRGVLIGALSLAAMNRFVDTIGLGDGSHVYLVDAKGTLIAQTSEAAGGTPLELKDQPIVQAVLGGRSGSMQFREAQHGEELLAAYVPIGQLGWGVVAAKPISAAYAAQTRLMRWLFWIALGCTGSVILLGCGLAYTLTRGIQRLVKAAERMGRGDFSARVIPQGRDEVTTLAIAFNGMAQEVQRSYEGLAQKTGEVEAINRELLGEVAERQQAEDEVRRLNRDLEQRVAERTVQLEAVNGELEAFTYTVSHDLKAPLRGIDGFARALQEDYDERLEGPGRRYLEMIRTSTRRMGELIDDLLRYSRLERRALTRKPIVLSALIDDVCGDFAEEIQARGIAVRTELAVEDVEAEREGLREAVANLVGNAVKFIGGPGGAITIGSRRDGDTVVLSVADTGIGFDMTYHDRIFQIFERLHRQEDVPGTGVGLAIVRKVAERHGGRAWAVSKPGQGSTFFLALPANAGGGA